MFDVRRDVLVHRRIPMIGHGVVAHGQRAAPHALGAFLKLGEHDQRRIGASATGRRLEHAPGPVAVLGRERPCFDKHAPLVGQLAGSLSAAAAGPAREAFAGFRHHDFRSSRKLGRVRFAKNSAHWPPPF
ncbi:MAG: hypothetical protein L6Q92_08150 [Phycisphaerae bacterium]|nr:hypothetical protein [Phycisphaerae bacterium]